MATTASNPTADEPAAASRPRVVMILANPFTHDTRVHKQARSLLEWGAEVHIVAMTAPGLPAEDEIDGIAVHRVDGRPGDVWLLLPAILFWPLGPGPLRRLLRRSRERPIVRAKEARPHPWVDRLCAALRRLPLPRWPVRLARRAGVRGRRAGIRLARVVRIRLDQLGRVGHRLQRHLKRAVAGFRHPVLRLFPFNVEAARRAIELAPDLIECHDLNTLLAGLAVKRLRPTPLIYDSHELWLHRNIGDRSRAWDRLGWAPIERFGIRRADGVFTVAEGICRHLERQYRLEQVHLIRNVQPYELPPPRTTLLADELGLDPETEIVLYPGAITINRGIEQMIDAAPHLGRGVFVVMGYARNASYLAELKERARGNGTLGHRIHFRDAVPIDEVSRYVASAALGVVPTLNVCLSYYFESSNKIFHCLMAGVPIVASDHAEKRLLVERHGIGRLFDETDPRDIARVTEETLADSAARETMRASCLEAARTLNWECEEHRLRTVIAGLIGDRLPPVPPVRLPAHQEPAVADVEVAPSP